MNKIGFGFLRLPRLDAKDEKSVDYELLNQMVDRFLELGGSYFDTAYTYLGGISEEALRKTLVERYPRERFRIADKLPGYATRSFEDCWKYLNTSLNRCGVDYFDVYLLHGLNAENYAIAQEQDQFSFLSQIKQEGLAKEIGFSYHDSPELLDRILTEHPDVDYVQLQINYLDWDSVFIQSRKCYETAVRHEKKIIVMEPVKGGSLAVIPDEAAALLRKRKPQESIASWAVRFASDLQAVETVLSGMNTMEQVEDNLRPMMSLTTEEYDVLNKVANIIRSNTAVACTGCGYCTSHCPVGMPILQYFSLYNEYARKPGEKWKMQYFYDDISQAFISTTACIGCGECARYCPQKLSIPEYLVKISQIFD